MKPRFKDNLAWEQAQLLMQPVFIRVLDNLRKKLEDCTWQSSYKETTVPVPGYHLCLAKDDRYLEIDLWDICYRVCFSDYQPTHILNEDTAVCEVEIDTRLLDETGEVDWHSIEGKTQQTIQQIFDNLPD
jgi:hypothetical protein